MNSYLIGGSVLVLVVLGALLKGSYTRNGELAAKLEDQASETMECVTANQSQLDSIKELRDRIDELTTLRQTEAAERERILTERDIQLAAARAEADRLEREREDEINTNPDCKDLSELSLDLFCPDTAQQLRQRSVSAGSHGDQGGGGSG